MGETLGRPGARCDRHRAGGSGGRGEGHVGAHGRMGGADGGMGSHGRAGVRRGDAGEAHTHAGECRNGAGRADGGRTSGSRVDRQGGDRSGGDRTVGSGRGRPGGLTGGSCATGSGGGRSGGCPTCGGPTGGAGRAGAVMAVRVVANGRGPGRACQRGRTSEGRTHGCRRGDSRCVAVGPGPVGRGGRGGNVPWLYGRLYPSKPS